LSHLFPNAIIKKQPDIGNCYFCSIGENVNKTGEEVRQDVSGALKIMNESDYGDFITFALQECPENSKYKQEYLSNKDKFVGDYADMIVKSCEKGEMDCNDCIWGGNYIDPVISSLYNKPVLSVAIGSGSDALLHGEQTSFNINELPENVQLAAQKMDMVDITEGVVLDFVDEDDLGAWGEDSETVLFTGSNMLILMQYEIPISYTEDTEKIMYLNHYRGPFISYLMTIGKAHIDAIDFGQHK